MERCPNFQYTALPSGISFGLEFCIMTGDWTVTAQGQELLVEDQEKGQGLRQPQGPHALGIFGWFGPQVQEEAFDTDDFPSRSCSVRWGQEKT